MYKFINFLWLVVLYALGTSIMTHNTTFFSSGGVLTPFTIATQSLPSMELHYQPLHSPAKRKEKQQSNSVSVTICFIIIKMYLLFIVVLILQENEEV